MHHLCIITSNKGKIEEFKQLIDKSFHLSFEDIDLPELQGDPQEVAKAKALMAFKQLNKPVLIDDGSLCYNAYNGLPGPYIKWFLKKMGQKDLAKMVEPFKDKTAYALCILAYMSAELESPILFVGRIDGEIMAPRGSSNYGWYSIFQPKGLEKTLAEMPPEEMNRHTHRYFACQILSKHFNQHKEEQ